jgi:hypothetical protein
MNRLIVILGVLVTAAAAQTPLVGQAPARSRLLVAYMTSSGELVPVARYDGTRWRNTWPEPIEEEAPLPVRTVREIPRAWLGQSVPMTWTTWSQLTGKQQRVTVTGVDRDGSCHESITLATSFQPAPRSDGLAFDRPTTVDAIVELPEDSPELEVFGREVAPHFRTAIAKGGLPQSGAEKSAREAEVFALARADTSSAETVIVTTVFRDLRDRVFFIEAERRFGRISAETAVAALSYGGWFRRDRADALVPLSASLVAFSTEEEKLPRYTPIGILRLGMGSIWAMSEWGIESQTIVLFHVSAKGVRKLTSADISGC